MCSLFILYVIMHNCDTWLYFIPSSWSQLLLNLDYIYSVIVSLSYYSFPEYCLVPTFLYCGLYAMHRNFILHLCSSLRASLFKYNFSEACDILIWKLQTLWRNCDFPWDKPSNICIWLFTFTTAFDLNDGDSGIYCILSSQSKYHADSPSKIKKERNFSLPPSIFLW